MSAGSQALERSALEAKDRDSLQQIAAAMGGKPASRAKKADIIDLILELAGVTTAGESSTDDADAPSATSDEESAPAPPRPRAASRARTTRSDDAAGDADDSSTSDTRGRPSEVRVSGEKSSRAGASGPARSDAATDSTAKTREASGDQGQAASADRTSEGRNGAGRGTDRTTEPDPASGGNGGDDTNGQGARDDGETGNRRRRRRGRDRPRDGQPAATTTNDRPADRPAGQGQADDQFLGEPVEVAGLLDLRDEGYGFLRLKGYLPSKDDVYVSVKQVRQFGLRKGDQLKGAARPASRNEKNPALLRIDEVNGADPEAKRSRAHFDELTPVIPDERLVLDGTDGGSDLTARLVDLVAPLGKGQRGLIVSPAIAARTTLVKRLAQAIGAHNPKVDLTVLLIDERPEQVTDMRRSVPGEVVASTFDRPADEHTMIAELVIERSKRLVEEGHDVVIILDGLSRLVRAYNAVPPSSGRSSAGVVDPAAVQAVKRFFGAARNIEEGGSLTILATAVTGTGSATDDIVLEELAPAANLRLCLDAGLAALRVDPPIELTTSGSDHLASLVAPAELVAVERLARQLAAAPATTDQMGRADRFEVFAAELMATPTNAVYLATTGADAD